MQVTPIVFEDYPQDEECQKLQPIKKNINNGDQWKIFFMNNSQAKQYQLDCKSNFSFSCFLVLYVSTILFLVQALNTRQLNGKQGTWSIVATTVGCILIFTETLFLLARVIFQWNDRENVVGKFSHHLLYEFLSGHIEDVIQVLYSGFACTLLLAAVNEDEHSIYQTSHHSNCDSMSAKMYARNILFFSLILVPTFLKSQINAIIISWLIAISAIAYTEIIDSSSTGMIVFAVIFSSVFCYESERQRRLGFFDRCESVAVDEIRQEELQAKMNKQLSEDQDLVQTLIGSTAHEMKTPLQSICMDLETLKYDYQHGELNNAVILSLESASKYMLMTMNGFLDSVKTMKNVQLIPSMIKVDLMHIITQAIQNMKGIDGSSHVLFEAVPAAIVRMIVSDEVWFGESLLSLLAYAVRNSHGGDVTVSVTLVEQRQDGSHLTDSYRSISDKNSNKSVHSSKYKSGSDQAANTNNSSHKNAFTSLDKEVKKSPRAHVESKQLLRVMVEDSGIGIPERSRKKLFQPTVVNQGLNGGSGLGLYVIYKRMEAIRGYCGVKGRRDAKSGNAYWFAVPYVPYVHASRRLDPLAETSSQDEKSSSCSNEARASKGFRGGRVAYSLSNMDTGSKSDEESQSSSLLPGRVALQRSVSSVATGKGTTMIFMESLDQIADKDVCLKPQQMQSDPAPTGLTSRRGNVLDGSFLSGAVRGDGDAGVALAAELCAASSETQQQQQQQPVVLLVDDSPLVLRVTTHALESLGFIVESAPNGMVGLQKMLADLSKRLEGDLFGRYKFVLIDFDMPEMGGIEAIRWLREVEEEPPSVQSSLASLASESRMKAQSLASAAKSGSFSKPKAMQSSASLSSNSDRELVKPGRHATTESSLSHQRLVIIGMSANSDEEAVEQAAEAGMDHFISKPFKKSDLELFLRERSIHK